MLNNYTTEIYLKNDNKSFELLLVDINNIINSAAQIIYPDVKDKLLYNIDDIKQEMLLKIWLLFVNQLIKFDSIENVNNFVLKIAEEVLEETRG
jgi:hypothetical protein